MDEGRADDRHLRDVGDGLGVLEAAIDEGERSLCLPCRGRGKHPPTYWLRKPLRIGSEPSILDTPAMYTNAETLFGLRRAMMSVEMSPATLHPA